jgi:hypothetical protein
VYGYGFETGEYIIVVCGHDVEVGFLDVGFPAVVILLPGLHVQDIWNRKRGQETEIGGTKRYCVGQPRPSVTNMAEDVVNLSPSSSASLASAGMVQLFC